MKIPKNTQGVVLTRINYAEADRILTVLTKDFGKVSLIAKGTRKEKSKLAGGIELFSVSDIGFIEGKSDLGTLTTARLNKQYNSFFNDLAKIEFGYSCLKLINKYTTTETGQEYFHLIKQLFEALNNPKLSLSAVSVWWAIQLSNVTGHSINIEETVEGTAFDENGHYVFEYEMAGFKSTQDGPILSEHIKYLRLALLKGPEWLALVKGGDTIAATIAPYLNSFVEYQF
jgi:DNA repair protein RecO (recombination protein O)